MYCAEAELRKTVTLFEPLPSQLAYPDLLDPADKDQTKISTNTNTAASRLLAKAGKQGPSNGGDTPSDTAVDNTIVSDVGYVQWSCDVVFYCHGVL